MYARYYHLFSKEEIVELLRTAMFQIVDLQEQKENIIIKAKPDQKIH